VRRHILCGFTLLSCWTVDEQMLWMNMWCINFVFKGRSKQITLFVCVCVYVRARAHVCRNSMQEWYPCCDKWQVISNNECVAFFFTSQFLSLQGTLPVPANYGSEGVFTDVAKRLGMKICVSSDAYNVYKNIAEIQEAVTDDPRCTRIHACRPRVSIIILINAG